MDARELALSIIGRLADGRANPQEFPFESFPAPYNQAIKLIKAHPEMIGDKDAIDILLGQALTYDEIVDAHIQASRLNGLGIDGVFNWAGNMREATDKLTMIPEMKRVLRACEQNDPVEWTSLYTKIGSVLSGRTRGPRPANQIDYKNYKPYMKSGIKYIDEIIGGWPTDGPIVVLASQGVGKSYFVFYAICSWLIAHPDETAAIYTLEMSDEHFLARNLEVYPEFIPLVECETPRLHISSTCRGVDEISAEVSTGKYGFIGIDAMKQLTKGGDTSVYDKTYQVIVEICRFQKIPVMVIAHPNREGKKSGKFISTYDAYMSGAAEDAAAMLISLNVVSYADPEWIDTRFVPVESENPQKTDRFYVCFWKFRDNRPAAMQQGLGAIRIEPDKHTGYYKQIWVGNALGNKLWPVRYNRPTSIGASQQPQPENKPTIRLNVR